MGFPVLVRMSGPDDDVVAMVTNTFESLIKVVLFALEEIEERATALYSPQWRVQGRQEPP